jgi:hypothetical protein
MRTPLISAKRSSKPGSFASVMTGDYPLDQ